MTDEKHLVFPPESAARAMMNDLITITDAELEVAIELLNRSVLPGPCFVMSSHLLRRALELGFPFEQLRGHWVVSQPLPTI